MEEKRRTYGEGGGRPGWGGRGGENGFGSRGGEGRFPGGENGGRGGHGGWGAKDGQGGGHHGFSITSLIDDIPGAHLLFLGSLNCARHRGFQMGGLMREGRMSVLMPTAADYATGRYLDQITDACRELHESRGITRFVLMYGCQPAVLSTDYDLLIRELAAEGITLTVHPHCHLCRTDFD